MAQNAPRGISAKLRQGIMIVLAVCCGTSACGPSAAELAARDAARRARENERRRAESAQKVERENKDRQFIEGECRKAAVIGNQKRRDSKKLDLQKMISPVTYDQLKDVCKAPHSEAQISLRNLYVPSPKGKPFLVQSTVAGDGTTVADIFRPEDQNSAGTAVMRLYCGKCVKVEGGTTLTWSDAGF